MDYIASLLSNYKSKINIKYTSNKFESLKYKIGLNKSER